MNFRLFWVLSAIFLTLSCAAFRDTVNTSPGLRWWLFSNFGAAKVCPEMLKRGAPLKLFEGGNTIGRYFPERCQTQVNDSAQTVTLQFGGSGYAWTPIAGRIQFAADAAIEYRMDFNLTKDATYVWAKPNRILSGPTFQVQAVENTLVDWATRTPVGYLANTFGNQIVSSKLAEGFTVVHTDTGDDFTLGFLAPPARPKKPFDTGSGERFVYANETIDIQANQVDFLGPFDVVENGQALFLRMIGRGPAVDVLLIRRGTGDLWRRGLQLGAPLGPPPEAPVTGFGLQPGAEVRQKLPLPQGQYYVVIDNSSVAGLISPPFNLLGALGANVATVSCSVELGETDASF